MDSSDLVQSSDLGDDPPVRGQNYLVLSYYFSGDRDRNGDKLPLIKIRGSYNTVEECHKRIKQFDNIAVDPVGCPFLITEVGRWIGLYSIDELKKNGDLDIEYRNEFQQKIMNQVKQSEDRAEQHFKDNIRDRVYAVKEDVKPENYPTSEDAITVLNREMYYKGQIDQMKSALGKLEPKLVQTRTALREFSVEEIEQAREFIQDAYDKNKPENIEDHLEKQRQFARNATG